ncbi:hypothetical protein GCM10023115_00510 [Pontixanthobacter gangjinensis]|uniref:Uncharacterized protein n=1 Tax=Pontixanthobacter gangjinensis TaxID=1028742 RepID=A0A6I4SIA7_9SPHN|nr:hypothetical protein [Pontixanthobacter gangjinensis]MXO55305.1 hypothetical protein [Pontixanthobacter gangjinensis]
MNSDPDLHFTSDHILHDGGVVEFHCSSDTQQWPWLVLPPDHPIVVQNTQYWTSVESSLARGTMDGSKWTALTWTKWTSGDPGAGRDFGPMVRGTSQPIGDDERPQNRICLYDAQDNLVCDMLSYGVVFRNRDFEAWRAKAKDDSAAETSLDQFEFAPTADVGSEGVGPSLISPLHNDGRRHAMGLITKANAFPPGHPFMSGSGDHVNATHLCEAGHQFLHLLEGGKPLRVTGGEMRFTRYVELARPIRIEETARNENDVSMAVTQGGKPCTTITLQFERR